MSLDTGTHRVLLCVAAVWVVSLAEAADMCVACSYNFAGEGTRDYKCVNDSLNQANSGNVSCNFATHSCTIQAQYRYTGFQQLQSLYRGCLPSTNPSHVCDPTDGRSCVFECKTSFCNVAPDGDLAKTYAASDSEAVVSGASFTSLLLGICLSSLAITSG